MGANRNSRFFKRTGRLGGGRAKKERFEIVEHTADIGVRAEGRDLAELFTNITLGMGSLMADTAKINPKIEKTIEISAEDRETLLVQWLNELIYLIEAEEIIFREYDIQEISDNHLTATVKGETLDPNKHGLKTEIKACTYHDLRMGRRNSGWFAQVIFDI